MLQRDRGRGLLIVLIAVSLAFPARAQQSTEDPAGSGDTLPRTGRIQGKVVDSATGRGMPQVVVHAYHIDSQAVFSSEKTRDNGRYRIEGVPLGWHELYVETSDGLFLGNQVVNVPPKAEVDVDLTVTRFADRPISWQVGKRRAIPGQDEPAVGEARLDRTARGKSFWKTPLGIALVSAGGALVIFAVVVSEDDSNEPPASPFTLGP